MRTADGRLSYRQSLTDMFKQTDTRWAPWMGIDANDEQAAHIAALTVLADAHGKGDLDGPAGPRRAGGALHDLVQRLGCRRLSRIA